MLCRGSLVSCPANALHTLEKCHKCNLATDQLVEKAIPTGVEVIVVPSLESRGQLSHITINNRAKLLGLTHEGWPVGRLVATQLADDAEDFYFELNDLSLRSRAEQSVANAIGLYRFAKATFAAVAATKVFVWNGRRPSDGPIYYAAESLTPFVYTYISGGSPGRIYCTQSSSVQNPLLSELTESISSLTSIHKSKISDLGAKYLNQYRNGTYKQVGYRSFIPPGGTSSVVGSENVKSWVENPKLKVLVVTSSPIEFIHLPEFEKAFGDDPYGWIERLAEDAYSHDFALCVKWHPSQAHAGQYERDRIARIINKSRTTVAHVSPEDSEDAYGLALEADVIVGTGSTVMLWAASLGRRVVAFHPRFYHFGGWTVVHDESLLISEIKAAGPAERERALEWAVYMSEFGSQMTFSSALHPEPEMPHLALYLWQRLRLSLNRLRS